MSGSALPQRVPVAVLGATGVVGQRFVERLVDHPWFEVAELAASERSTGKLYGEAAAWRLGGREHAGLADRRLVAADPAAIAARVVFSALDSGPARELEPAFAAAGATVFSNAAAFRMDPRVPLMVPEVNPDHLGLLEQQRRDGSSGGGIVCNPNCTATVLVMALAPLHERFGVEQVIVTSMQAASGAGYPGVASLDALANVVPYIAGEEDKLQEEIPKMLGTLGASSIDPAPVTVSAACNRVPVIDGHTEAVSVRLGGDPDPGQVAEALTSWDPEPQRRGLPTAPRPPIRCHDDPARPQPRLDVGAADGMPIHIGRIRRCPVLGIRFVVLGHNTQRGAAGGSVLNAELAVARGLLPASPGLDGGDRLPAAP